MTQAAEDAALAARLLALDPAGLGGAVLRGPAGPARDAWLAALRQALPTSATLRKVPLSVSDERLLGGLDLAATLRAGRPVAQAGLLAEAQGGILVLAMAERLERRVAGLVAAALDSSRLGVVLLDEGIGPDESPPAALLDRLAFRIDLSSPPGPIQPSAPCRLAHDAEMPDAIIETLSAACVALGIDSLRAPVLALQAARGLAALAGRDVVDEADAATAARLVLAPRATRLPEAAAQPAPTEAPETEPDAAEGEAQADRTLDDLVLDAAVAAIPPDLLAALAAGAAPRRAASGRAGAARAAGRRGRPAGVRRGEPGPRARLNLIETLRAAAPWQRLRGAQGRVAVRRDDFRVTIFRERSATTSIFAVDASGSQALHRLAETKGAVELLLAESYARRDQVAVLAFRGTGAELLLPPTRSLVRAKRSLAALPGGGGTPLASAIEAAAALADAVRRRGASPVIVLLTDGRGNVARDGTPGRARGEADALAAARVLAGLGCAALLVDTAPRPQPAARALADAMAARYFPLPQADAAALARAVAGARA